MDAADHLDALLGRVDASIGPAHRVLELGCRRGPMTGVLADRAAHVVAFELDPLELSDAEDRHIARDDVTWLLGDGDTLEGVEDASVDVVIARELFRRLPGVKAQLAHVEEIGRVLRPGGVAVLVVSTARPDQAAPAAPPAEEAGASRRDLLRNLGGALRAPAPKARPAGVPIPLEPLGAVAMQAGLEIERMEGSGTPQTVVLARRSSRPVS